MQIFLIMTAWNCLILTTTELYNSISPVTVDFERQNIKKKENIGPHVIQNIIVQKLDRIF